MLRNPPISPSIRNITTTRIIGIMTNGMAMTTTAIMNIMMKAVTIAGSLCDYPNHHKKRNPKRDSFFIN